MHQNIYQEILSQVQSPTRYAGNEINTVKKNPDLVNLEIALVFPDLYEIGTSHFGLQILYSIINRETDLAAERFFAPAPDMEALMRERQIPCLSMESRRPLAQFDVIGFSLLYELNFTNILTLLELSRIPFFAHQRDETFPLVIGGGPCAFNPEPLADFFDLFVIGDGEQAIIEISRKIIDFKKEGDGKKHTLLRTLSKIAGVYVPQFFNVSYNAENLQITTPVYDDYKSVRKAFLPELTADLFPDTPIIPFGKPVHDRLRLEIARGCSRGCRFCQAGMIYRPVRERKLTELTQIAQTSLKRTGYADISLLSLSTGDYSRLPELIPALLGLGAEHCCAVSLPSIRAEKLTPDLMEVIKSVRKTGFTIAPEAGSQRLRDIINKNLSEESIRSTVENALELGWKNIKLYFMMGLPFETMDDIKEICTLSTDLANRYAKGKKGINVSTTSFIPKAHTPFQRCAQISLQDTINNLQYLKDNLHHKKVKLKWQAPEMSLIEGVWARGDRKLSKLLVAAYNEGCRLDGWSDHFNFSLWENAFEKTGIDPAFYTSRKRGEKEPLPWDHIHSGVRPEFLAQEYEKAQKMALTPDCREFDCTGCGVCDFKTLKPIICETGENDPCPNEIQTHQLPDDAFRKVYFSYEKLESARFFGHLELATIIRRAFRRAGLKVKYSQGFNPSMRLSFENALPVGMESESEWLSIFLERKLRPETAIQMINQHLPEGLSINEWVISRKSRADDKRATRYSIRFKSPCLTPEEVDRFLDRPEFIVEDKGKKGRVRKTDLRKAVHRIHFHSPKEIDIHLCPFNGRALRPNLILSNCFKINNDRIQAARIIKRKQD